VARRSEETVFDRYDSESPIATELRRLYNNIVSLDERSRKSYLITSSVRGEGKSTMSAYLATTISQFPQKRTLVVDTDLRRPRMHEHFGLTLRHGLYDCLADNVDPLNVVKSTRLDNLDVITAGGTADAPSKLFESEMLSEFFAKVRFYYDIVIVDSAPALAVSDTLFLCGQVEAVILVVLAGSTPRAVVQRAKQALVDARANIVGVAVNNTSEALPYYHDYKYYGAYEKD
jgi:capsular exopolysaccharide synthesis family protein